MTLIWIASGQVLIVPDLVGEIRQLLQNCVDVARFRITGMLDFLEEAEENKDIDTLLKQLLNEQGSKLAAKINALKTGDEKHDKNIDQEAIRAILSRGSLITSLVQTDNSLRLGLEHFIETSIVTAWTAFEAMSADLWVAAINIHPKGLAALNGPIRYPDKIKPRKNLNRGLDSDAADQKQKRGDEKAILLRKLHEHNYDISQKMGSILKYKYSFNSLWNIRRAYVDAFTGETERVDLVIMHDTFDELSALRNVIVHNACICDADYLQDQKHIKNIPKAEGGNKVFISGGFAQTLLIINQFYCKSLIQAVDSWISDN